MPRFACEDLRVALVLAAFRVDLRVEELVLLVLGRFAFPRLLADFLVPLRLEAADCLPLAACFALPRLVAVLPLPAAFVALGRFLRLRDFSVLPVTA